jgi:hypothetical protein
MEESAALLAAALVNGKIRNRIKKHFRATTAGENNGRALLDRPSIVEPKEIRHFLIKFFYYYFKKRKKARKINSRRKVDRAHFVVQCPQPGNIKNVGNHSGNFISRVNFSFSALPEKKISLKNCFPKIIFLSGGTTAPFERKIIK